MDSSQQDSYSDSMQDIQDELQLLQLSLKTPVCRRLEFVLDKVSKGEWGLCKQFWLGLIAADTIIGLLSIVIDALQPSSSDGFVRGCICAAFFLFIFLPYYLILRPFYPIAATVGVWSAAKRYSGSVIWAVLARLVSVLVCAADIYVMFMLAIEYFFGE